MKTLIKPVLRLLWLIGCITVIPYVLVWCISGDSDNWFDIPDIIKYW